MSIPQIGNETFSLLLGTILEENRAARQDAAAVDATGATPQSESIAITSPSAADYTLTFADALSAAQGGTGISEAVTVTSPGTDATVLAGLFKAAIEEDHPILGGLLDLSGIEQTSGTLVVPWLPGVTGTCVDTLDAGGDIAITTTAASAAPQYLYGQAVQLSAPAASFPSYLGSQIRCVDPVAVDGSVLTTTMTYSSTGDATMTVGVVPTPGAAPVFYTLGWAMGANLAASVANLEAEWPLELTGVDAPTITTATGVVTATFPPGVSAFVVSESTASGTVATVVTEAEALPGVAVVHRTNDESPNFTYPGPTLVNGPLIGGTIPLILGGAVDVLVTRPSGGVSLGGKAWYGTAGAEQGLWFAAGSSTRIPAPNAVWQGNYAADSTLAILRIL